MASWKQALTRAINAEVAAEQAAATAEDERRRTWWDTTWALAAVPRADWGDATAEYIKRTGHSKSYGEQRRRTGERLSQTTFESGLPAPRFAIVASDWIGKGGDESKTAEAIRMLVKAEKNEMSLREFKQVLTGSSWTSTPENLTEADEDAVVNKVARERPETIARQARKPKVARHVARDPASRKAVDTEVVAAINEDPEGWREQDNARSTGLKDGLDAAAGEMNKVLDGEHPTERELAMAIMHLKAAVREREALEATEHQAKRIDTKADEAEMLLLAVRGGAVNEDELLALLNQED